MTRMTNGCQRLSSETMCDNFLQILIYRQFGCGKAFTDKIQIALANARTIILDLQQLQPAVLDSDVYGSALGVQRVFDHFLERIEWAVDNLKYLKWD